MAWERLKTDYKDAVWSGLRKFIPIDNGDGSYSVKDVTQYTVYDESFFGAYDANRINTAVNSTKKIRKDAMRRLKRLMKNFKDGTITEEFFDKSFTSRIGSIKHADTYNLVQKITCEAKELKESHA